MPNINAILMIVGGTCVTYYGYARRGLARPKAAGLLRFCGPTLVTIGIWLLLFCSPAIWVLQRIAQCAEAEFPSSPTGDNAAGMVNGTPIPQVTYKYNDPEKDICLILSRSAVVATNTSEEQILQNFLTHSTPEGFSIANQRAITCGDFQGHEVKYRNPEKHATVILRVVFAQGNIYRAIACFTSGSETDEEIKRFVESFRVRRTASGG